MTEPQELLDRLVAATNAHDLDALVGCFGEDYVNETPAHPSRGFAGKGQVRRNWEQIFAFVADLRAQVLATGAAGNDIWSEWEMRGTRADGSTHLMRGVIILTVEGGLARRARFYLEPVEDTSGNVDDAVHRQVVR